MKKLPAVKSGLDGLKTYLSALTATVAWNKNSLETYKEEISNLQYDRCDPDVCRRRAAALKEDLDDIESDINDSYDMFILIFDNVEFLERG